MNLPLVEPATPWMATAPRHLSDDVLQSAEEAVLVDSVPVEGVKLLGNSSSADVDGSRLAPRRRSLGEFVAARPGQTALVAAVVGGIAAGAIRRLLQRRRAAS